MKKFFSAFIALTMMATTFVSSAFAASDINVSAKANKATYEEGDTVTITVKLAGQPFNAFGINLLYDDAVFEYQSASKPKSSDLEAVPTFGQETGVAYAIFGVTDNQPLQYEDEDTGDMVDANYTYQVKFTVKSKVEAKDYTFALADYDPVNVTFECGKGEKLNPVFTNATVHVNGTKTDDQKIETAIDTEYPEVTKDGIKAIGTSGTVTVPEGKSFSQIDFKFVNNKGGEGSYTWEFDMPISATVTYGLNIYNVPADVTSITCTSAEAK